VAARLPGRWLVRGLQVLLTLVISAANLIGAAITFLLAALVVPGPKVGDVQALRISNLALAGIYAAVAVPMGTIVGKRMFRGPASALRENRPLVEREQRQVVRGPATLFWVQMTFWMASAVVFAAVNATSSLQLGVRVGIIVVLGGISTASVAYLLAERFLRVVAAQALAAGDPDRLAVRSVSVRLQLTWALGTGVPVIGALLVGISYLIGFDASARELAVTMVVLSTLALSIGFLSTCMAAKATSDPIKAVRKALRRVEEGALDTVVPVYDGTQIGQLQAGFNRMVVGLRERERIRDLFGRHVGEDVAHAALERGIEMGGEVREVAVLFVDLIGSTALAAERPPGEVVDLLNRFFAIVVEVVEDHGGWINKFEGDAALAIWGAPVEVDDCASRSLAAARVLAERVRSEVPELEAGVGVSGGEAVAGNVGAAQRFEYTVIGDPVNEAARLTELAKSIPGRVVANAELVVQATPEEAAHWEKVQDVTLRGRQQPTAVAAPRHGGPSGP
jgi:adenylate cyclase